MSYCKVSHDHTSLTHGIIACITTGTYRTIQWTNNKSKTGSKIAYNADSMLIARTCVVTYTYVQYVY